MTKKKPPKIIEYNLNKLIKAPYNPGEMLPSEFLKLKKSYKEFKDLEPIVFNIHTNEILDGHHRLDAYLEEGISDVWVLVRGDIGWVFTKEDIEIKDENQMKVMNVALRKIRGDFSFPKLEEIFIALKEDHFVNLELTGFDETEIDDILANQDLQSGDYEKEEFDKLVDKFSDKKGKSKKDENWFYVEFYGDNERYQELKEALQNKMADVGKHEIDPDYFYDLIMGNN